ncbi:uncharacterized protein BDZ99DRAFT_504780 [Mytilinidion resinicola]|uniref:Aminoglycoside phosphotransferase domain-containing protein n=1 Tax=Mytilinidion resinicola TaxID=574789 RepID=A0A6A6Z927_9PEZI|nr:uncharacterized protein BDZ99DRAFT_504780 [Mytilinidion resinicola]KAF2816794.1 hypothetical protein BDZ99DRAFT_504780 [Mytilinidion resinicola]
MTAAGFRWNVFSSLPEGMTLRSRAEAALEGTNWDALLEYASKLRDGTECKLLPDIGMGANNMVRVIEFNYGKRWAARVLYDEEVAFLNFIRESSNVPVPMTYAHETADTVGVHAPFILMECVEGNVGTDIRAKDAFFDSIADVHVELSTVLLPKIGCVVGKNEDGTYIQGPIWQLDAPPTTTIPGIGGPFDMAIEFFQAWSKNTPFGNGNHIPHLLAMGGLVAQMPASIEAFRAAIIELAGKISVCDKGSFPIWHNDCGNNNIIMDDNFRVLGVVDWEMAYAAPWEVFGDYPLFVGGIPRAMDAPWVWDEQGNPLDERSKLCAKHEKQYLAAVIRAEEKRGLTLENHMHLLSAALQDTKRHALAKAMWLFEGGKQGFYHLVTEELAQSLLKDHEVSDVKEDVTTASSSGTSPSTI